MAAGKTYFPNLDGLRALAVSMVIVSHIHSGKAAIGLPFAGDEERWKLLGHSGVMFFFVLSGFLITYLILEEERKFGRIHVRYFEMRRILRIWPLYFLMVVLALFVLPRLSLLDVPIFPSSGQMSDPWGKLALYVLFLPTLVNFIFNKVFYALHLWSIGTEEHFYLIWPFLLRLFKRFRWQLMVGIFFGYAVVYRFLYSPLSADLPSVHLLRPYWENFNIDVMAVGGLCAWLVYKRSPVLKVLLDRRLFIFVLLVVVLGMATGTRTAIMGYRTYSVLFGLLVLNLAANPWLGNVLEHPILRYLGRISYGLYIYHMVAVMATLNLAVHMGITSGLVTYPVVFALTIAMSALSYRYFEFYFLRLKGRYRPQTVTSTPAKA
ncbi:MAG: acyltransferase family protein [Flavobacteriales bacterium]